MVMVTTLIWLFSHVANGSSSNNSKKVSHNSL
jgi:hypothetical protein